MNKIDLIKEIRDLKPEEFKKIRKAVVERGIAKPTLKELVKWIFEDLEKELPETTVMLKVKEKYVFMVRET